MPFGCLAPECSSLRGEANKHYWPQKGAFLAIRARKRPAEQPNRHLPETQRYPELPQNLGNIWFHWIRFVWGQKSALYGRSVEKKTKKKLIFGPKMQFFVKNPGGFFQPNVPIRYIILLSNRIHRYDNIWFPFGSQHLTQLRTLMAIFYTAQEINVNFPFLE